MSRRGTRLQATADLRELIAARIKQAQKDRGLTVEQLARETGISMRLVQKHRAADNAPSFEYLGRYAKVLKKDVAWFLREAA